jgi:hypothetical protein
MAAKKKTATKATKKKVVKKKKVVRETNPVQLTKTNPVQLTKASYALLKFAAAGNGSQYGSRWIQLRTSIPGVDGTGSGDPTHVVQFPCGDKAHLYKGDLERCIAGIDAYLKAEKSPEAKPDKNGVSVKSHIQVALKHDVLQFNEHRNKEYVTMRLNTRGNQEFSKTKLKAFHKALVEFTAEVK